MNPDSGEILSSELTTKEVSDLSMVGPWLDQIQSPLLSVMADGAYDGDPVYHTIAARQPQLPPIVIIPPRVMAVQSAATDTACHSRDRHIAMMQAKGRRSWGKRWAMGNERWWKPRCFGTKPSSASRYVLGRSRRRRAKRR